jgi:hypothetical protein
VSQVRDLTTVLMSSSVAASSRSASAARRERMMPAAFRASWPRAVAWSGSPVAIVRLASLVSRLGVGEYAGNPLWIFRWPGQRSSGTVVADSTLTIFTGGETAPPDGFQAQDLIACSGFWRGVARVGPLLSGCQWFG